MSETTLHIDGVPKGQPRVKAFSRGGHAGVYTPGGAHQTWREQVILAAQAARPADIEALQGAPVEVIAVFRLPRPKSHYTKKGLRPTAPDLHTSKPDLDNVVKLVLDALTACGYWRDDSQVCRVDATKQYADLPGARIVVRWGKP